MRASLHDIALLIDGTVIGDSATQVQALSPIDEIKPDALIFADGTDHLKKAEQSEAAAILVSKNVTQSNKPLIQVADPFQGFIKLLKHFYPAAKPVLGIHPTAIIAPDVILGENISIGPYVIIEEDCNIGDNCIIKSHVHIGNHVTIGPDTCIHPHVTLYDYTTLGARIAIHASSVIGSDGFGYTAENGQHVKIPHVGRVVIEDDVEIGANTVVDRATIGETLIGKGTKIDNLVQIAHSVKLGQHNILCAFTGIAGSTHSGNHVIFAAGVGVSDHVRIDDEVILGARAGVPPKKHLKQGLIYLGTPARPREKAIEHEMSTTRIPLMRKQLKRLSEQVNLLKEKQPSLSSEQTLDEER
ncbi:MAG: UDP-3-O-(3-hydroxymyristoyl)glucosamine N-acyltransferase [Gammaproteobacteria bacterium]|nr:UDP-3-O-(3-hydroxymyristoyl)glucosamine N-acyltransferase [Gammaproteobacteria bacterium]MCH9763608.1 UDP-3-O-(3-hydroxymyristoyl)glucosamine N-acyltransferase [Gammaproteobacteria bacterium]